MKVKRIEMIGFKSFAERTVFDFHPGITCIVGPNGCGKSNIVDAFRWVLGEQSAKTLRGDRMYEVIFSGSETKKPMGMAEVTLHLIMPEAEDNGDLAEGCVTVTRRLYRSGDSEYLINGRQCRLKDIREIFLDTGLELRSYSILEQGRIGEIINAKPEERRFLIEEVAGIMKYKVRRAEAEAKLQNSKYNLQRVNDILGEVKKQRATLQRQAKKAERYRRLLEELKDLELRQARREFLRLQKAMEELTETLKALKDQEAVKAKEVTSLEASLQVTKTRLTEMERSLQDMVGQLQRYENEASQRERQYEITTKEIEFLKETLKATEDAIERTEGTISEKERLAQQLNADLDLLLKQKEELQEALTDASEGERALRQTLRGIEDALEEKRRVLFNITDRIGSYRNSMNTLSIQIEGMQKRLSQAERELEEAQRRIKELNSTLKEIRSKIGEHETALEELRTERQAITDELLKERSNLQVLTDRRVELIGHSRSLQSEIQTLTGMTTPPLRRQELEEKGVRLLAIVSEILSVPAEYETAVEAALSDKVKGFIVGTEGELREAVEYVYTAGAEKTTFILNQEVECQDGPPLRPLKDVVVVQGPYQGVVRMLLNGYYLAEDLQSAIKQSRLNRGIKVVTNRGEVVEAGAVVTCGRQQGVLPVARKIRQLKRELEALQKESSEVETTIRRTSERIQELKDTLKEIESEMAHRERQISLQRAEEGRYREDLERFNRKAEMLTIEIEQLKEEISSSEQQKEEYSDRLTEAEAKKEEVNSEILSLQEERRKTEEVLQRRLDALTEKKISLQVLSEKLGTLRKEKASTESELKRLRLKREALLRDLDNKKNQIREKEDLLRELRQTLKETLQKREELKREATTRQREIETVKAEVSEREKRLKALSKELQVLMESRHQSEIEETEIRTRVEALKTQVLERYKVDIGDLDLPPAEEDLSEAIEKKKAELVQMEPVNMAALEEFKEVDERYRFLTEQQTDIENSIDELQAAIRRIDSTTKEMLIEAFQNLNGKFSEVFVDLFGGGRAELRLTEDNPLTAGIEIIAQPPGKKLQNINLLSGGEKALTALALMFAGFLLKPTPLCILDEADSPLDENNTEKFKAMLRELSGEIQFIIITHNRRTMEVADHLYGITMEEPGVSRVLSLQLT